VQQKTFSRCVFIFLIISLAGCSANPNDSPASLPAKRFAGVSLRVACPEELTQRIVAQTARGWSDRYGVNLQLISYDPEKDRPDSRADVWVLEAMSLPHWASRGELRPLPEELTAKDGPLQWTGLLDLYGKRLLVWDRVAYAVPLLGDAPLCFYRKDLFAAPTFVNSFRSRQGRELAAPATWEEFAVIAEYFLEARQDGMKTPSLPPLPRSDRDLDRLFYTVAASFARRAVGADGRSGEATREDLFSFHFDAETGRPRIAGMGCVKALQLLQRLQACRPAGSDPQPWRAFRDGRAVLCVGDARLLGAFQERDSPVRDRVGVCLVPGHRGWYDFQTGSLRGAGGVGENRVPYLGEGAFVVTVPRSSTQTEAALALLEELGGRNGSQQIVLEPAWGGGVTRLAQLDEDWGSFRLEAAQATQLRQALRRTLQPPPSNPLVVLRLPRESEFRAKLVGRVRAALEGNQAATEEGASAVLRGVAYDWDRLIDGQMAEHLRAYRLSLGLQ